MMMKNIAELIGLYLTKECFDTHIVNDGESAIKAVTEYAPNLVLLDIMLPGIDGYEVLREIRKDSKLPVLCISAKGETFDKVLGSGTWSQMTTMNLSFKRNGCKK